MSKDYGLGKWDYDKKKLSLFKNKKCWECTIVKVKEDTAKYYKSSPQQYTDLLFNEHYARYINNISSIKVSLGWVYVYMYISFYCYKELIRLDNFTKNDHSVPNCCNYVASYSLKKDTY